MSGRAGRRNRGLPSPLRHNSILLCSPYPTYLLFGCRRERHLRVDARRRARARSAGCVLFGCGCDVLRCFASQPSFNPVLVCIEQRKSCVARPIDWCPLSASLTTWYEPPLRVCVSLAFHTRCCVCNRFSISCALSLRPSPKRSSKCVAATHHSPLTTLLSADLLWCECVNVCVVQASLHQFQHDSAQPEHAARLEALEREVSAMVLPNEPQIAQYLALRELGQALHSQLREFTTAPAVILPYLQPGRVLYIRGGAAEGADDTDGVCWFCLCLDVASGVICCFVAGPIALCVCDRLGLGHCD
jgi:hypothetical protein